MKHDIYNKPPLFVEKIFIKCVTKNNNGIVKVKKVKKEGAKTDNKDDYNDICIYKWLKSILRFILCI